MQILAVAGMIAAILTGYPQVMLAVGRPRELLRFNVGALVALHRGDARARALRPHRRLPQRRRLPYVCCVAVYKFLLGRHLGIPLSRPVTDIAPAFVGSLVLLAVAWPLRVALAPPDAGVPASSRSPRRSPGGIAYLLIVRFVFPAAWSDVDIMLVAIIPSGLVRRALRRKDRPPCRWGLLAVCGIVGQARRRRPVDPGAAGPHVRGLEHRGPDSRGDLHHDGRSASGIQRLRVIDLATGDQPVYNEDRSVAVVLNGEIYNYRELRAEPASPTGTASPRDGDTEVIAHLYEEEGADFVDIAGRDVRLRALGRAPRGGCFVARDRIGKKPLFYAERGGTISFASELWALLRRRRDLARGRPDGARPLSSPTPTCPARSAPSAHVRKLPPGLALAWHDGKRPDRALLGAGLLPPSST